MNIIKRAEALKLFNAGKKLGKTLSRMKYDGGKYEWHGSEKHYLGRDIKVDNTIVALYMERRQDVHGPYAYLMAIIER